MPGANIFSTSDPINEEIYNCGKELIDSDFFAMSLKQVHHKKTSLYKHIMSVARHAVLLCNIYEAKGHKINRKRVILGALCHDLGMIGRKDLYSNDVTAWFRHPWISAKRAKQFFPDIDKETLRIIKRHMWPITFLPPVTPEEWILIKADKAASFDDLSGIDRTQPDYQKHRE